MPNARRLETRCARGAKRLTRNGAHGFLSSIGEMSGLATIHLDQAQAVR